MNTSKLHWIFGGLDDWKACAAVCYCVSVLMSRAWEGVGVRGCWPGLSMQWVVVRPWLDQLALHYQILMYALWWWIQAAPAALTHLYPSLAVHIMFFMLWTWWEYNQRTFADIAVFPSTHLIQSLCYWLRFHKLLPPNHLCVPANQQDQQCCNPCGHNSPHHRGHTLD